MQAHFHGFNMVSGISRNLTWALRSFTRDDLETLACWIDASLQPSCVLPGTRKRNIQLALEKEFEAKQGNTWSVEFIGTLDGDPQFYIDAQPCSKPKGLIKKKAYDVCMIINSNRRDYESIYGPAWDLTLNHFFAVPRVNQVFTSVSATDTLAMSFLLKMGFSFFEQLPSYTYRFSCKKSHFPFLKG